MKRFRHLWPAALILLGGLALFWWQRETTRGLQRELTLRREAVRDLQRLRRENERLRQLLAEEDGSASGQVKAEITQLRKELANAEQKRPKAQSRARPTVGAPANRPAEDRLTEQEAIRISDFKNLGQATPGAAYQTFVWTVAQDNISALKPLLHLSSASHEKLKGMWSELPPESRARFNEPEQIVMMMLAMDVLDEDGFKIVGETPQGSEGVLLHVARFKHGRMQGEKKIPMRQGATGWQLVIPDEAIETLPQAIAQASLYVAPPEKP